jgi:hypothetical protein
LTGIEPVSFTYQDLIYNSTRRIKQEFQRTSNALPKWNSHGGIKWDFKRSSKIMPKEEFQQENKKRIK